MISVFLNVKCLSPELSSSILYTMCYCSDSILNMSSKLIAYSTQLDIICLDVLKNNFCKKNLFKTGLTISFCFLVFNIFFTFWNTPNWLFYAILESLCFYSWPSLIFMIWILNLSRKWLLTNSIFESLIMIIDSWEFSKRCLNILWAANLLFIISNILFHILEYNKKMKQFPI